MTLTTIDTLEDKAKKRKRAIALSIKTVIAIALAITNAILIYKLI